MIDSFGRNIDYMRISITDRCNLRCRYCMPDGVEWLPMEDILTYEEILRVCRAAAGLGIRRVDLLPYHTLGREKYDKLSMDYSLKGIPMMDRKSLYPLGAVGRKLGVEVTVGGRKTD